MINCFTIHGGRVKDGIAIADDGFIHVGESGRSRKLVLVPVPERSIVVEKHLMSVETPMTIVLIRDHSGYRGSWHLAAFATHRCSLDGQKPPLSGGSEWMPQYECPDCGEVFTALDSQFRHPAAPARKLAASEIGIVIAEGECAQGLAGYVGGGPEYLIAVKPATFFSIRRSGRLYGGSTALNVKIAANGTPIVTDAWQGITTIESRNAWRAIL